MGRRRRQLISGKVYEFTPRLKEGLPFVCAEYMNTILKGILARVQRDSKVTLCHYIGMANHFHLIVVVKDKEQATKFLQEFKKKITDALKRLHGREHLLAWEPNSAMILLPTAVDVENRICYLYTNPARANLVESIKDYPGLSSWDAFTSLTPHSRAQYKTVEYWVSAPCIPYVTKGVSPMRDHGLTKTLREACTFRHTLIVEPHAWLCCFRKNEIKEVAQRIIDTVQETQSLLIKTRQREKQGVFNPSRLQNEVPRLSGYKPKKKERKIFLICHDKELRLYLIAQFDEFCRHCSLCYQRMSQGELVRWPPAAFIPPFRGLANAICW